MKKYIKMMLVAVMAAGMLLLSACGGKEGEGEQVIQWVDLGLPSGLLWASCNVGANNPEDRGNYYAWGETTTKESYARDTYSFMNNPTYLDNLTKYCTQSDNGYNGFTDNLTTLEPIDDAATQVMGDGARMPTKEECQELIDNTTFEWTTKNGVKGCKVTGANGNSIFLPATGVYTYNVHENVNMVKLWTATLHADPSEACILQYNQAIPEYNIEASGKISQEGREKGLAVRAVRKK